MAEILINAEIWANKATGTTTSAYLPLHSGSRSYKAQQLVLASELEAAGLKPGAELRGIGYQMTFQPAIDINNFRIDLAHTNITGFVADVWGAPHSAFTNVLHMPVVSRTSILTTGYTFFTFSTPFFWDGSNLLIQTTRDSDNYSSGGTTITRRLSSTSDGYRYQWYNSTTGNYTYPFNESAFAAPSSESALTNPAITIQGVNSGFSALYDMSIKASAVVEYTYDTMQEQGDITPYTDDLKLWKEQDTTPSTITDGASTLNTGARINRTQVIVLASELLAAGMKAGDNIVSLGLKQNIVSTRNIENFRIHLGHTDQYEYPLTGRTWLPVSQVLHLPLLTASSINTGRFTNFAFDTSWEWDGVSNLIVETSKEQTGTTTGGETSSVSFSSGPYRMGYSYDTVASTYPFTTEYPTPTYRSRTRVPEMQFTIATNIRNTLFDVSIRASANVETAVDTRQRVYVSKSYEYSTQQEFLPYIPVEYNLSTNQIVTIKIDDDYDMNQEFFDHTKGYFINAPQDTEVRQVDHMRDGFHINHAFLADEPKEQVMRYHMADYHKENAEWIVDTKYLPINRPDGTDGKVWKRSPEIGQGTGSETGDPYNTVWFHMGVDSNVPGTLSFWLYTENRTVLITTGVVVETLFEGVVNGWRKFSFQTQLASNNTIDDVRISVRFELNEEPPPLYIADIDWGFPRPVYGKIAAKINTSNIKGWQLVGDTRLNSDQIIMLPVDEQGNLESGWADSGYRIAFTATDLVNTYIGRKELLTTYDYDFQDRSKKFTKLIFYRSGEYGYQARVLGGEYGIATVSDWKNINNDRLGNYTLLNDLDFENIPMPQIGWTRDFNYGYGYFYGQIDGKGFTLKNIVIDMTQDSISHLPEDTMNTENSLTSKKALISAASGEYVSIKNLNIDGIRIETDYGGATLIADCPSICKIEIDNVTVKNANVIAKWAGRSSIEPLGGLIGYLDSYGPNGNWRDEGRVSTFTNITMENIRVESYNDYYVGIFAGYMNLDPDIDSKIEAVKINTATIQNRLSAVSYIGGVFGNIAGINVYDVLAQNITIDTSGGSVSYLGGFAGYGISGVAERVGVENFNLIGGTGNSNIYGFANRFSRVNKCYITGNWGTGNITVSAGFCRSDFMEQCYVAMKKGTNIIINEPFAPNTPFTKQYLYFDSTLTPGTSATAVGKTTAQMKTKEELIGFNFLKDWTITPSRNDGYPIIYVVPDIITISGVPVLKEEHLLEEVKPRQITLIELPNIMWGVAKDKASLIGQQVFPKVTLYADPKGTIEVDYFDARETIEDFEYSRDGIVWGQFPPEGALYSTGEEQIRIKVELPLLARFYIKLDFYPA